MTYRLISLLFLFFVVPGMSNTHQTQTTIHISPATSTCSSTRPYTTEPISEITTAQSLPTSHTIPPILATESGIDGECTILVIKAAVWIFGPTYTTWPISTTTTQFVECGDCVTAIPHYIGGHGPVAVYTKTIAIMEPTTVTQIECIPLASDQA